METIVVLNAGSSSIKFSLFAVQGDDLLLENRGQIEGIYTAPHFIAKDKSGAVLAEKRWDAGHELGHQGALEYLQAFMQQQRDGRQLIGIGHRVVHGGPDYAKPVRMDQALLQAPGFLAELRRALVPTGHLIVGARSKEAFPDDPQAIGYFELLDSLEQAGFGPVTMCGQSP